MAEYTRGLDSGNERSGHNNQQEKAARRLEGIDFEAVNFEQRRAPYGKNNRIEDSGTNDADNRSGTGKRRDDA